MPLGRATESGANRQYGCRCSSSGFKGVRDVMCFQIRHSDNERIKKAKHISDSSLKFGGMKARREAYDWGRVVRYIERKWIIHREKLPSSVRSLV